MTQLFLLHEDIQDLTGLQQPHAQCRWLKSHGWIFQIDIHGRPKVSRSFFEIKMTGQYGAANDPTVEEYFVNTPALRRK